MDNSILTAVKMSEMPFVDIYPENKSKGTSERAAEHEQNIKKEGWSHKNIPKTYAQR